jgi:hypothetical protein
LKSGTPALEPNPLYRTISAEFINDRLIVNAGITTYFDNFFLKKSSKNFNSDS